MARYRILPYRQGSKSAKALSLALGGKVLKLEGSKFKPKTDDVVVNWGNTSVNEFASVLNPSSSIRQASNKLLFFQAMATDALAEAITPRFWVSKDEIPDDAYPIVCRTVLAGHSGDGIVLANNPSELVPAPLYVQYVKKQDEYRVHVGRSSYFDTVDGTAVPVIDIISLQKKARRHDTPDNEVNWQVRNHKNGFVFVRNNVTPPASVLEVAKQALLRTGLDFGAVDVVWNAHQQKAYVLEINTAPGLEGTTVTDYATFFKERG